MSCPSQPTAQHTEADVPETWSRIQRLSDHIDVLLSCVYSPSLQHLHSTVQECSKSELRLWLRYSESKAVVLADLIIAGLEYDHHAVDLVQYFARFADIRNLMLNRKPQLMEGLLKASLANEKSFERYSPAATSLLSPAFLDDYVLPGNIGAYISALVQAVSTGDKIYLRQLEVILRQNTTPCLKNISSNQQYVLTSTLANLLADKDTSKVLLALSCLASLARPGVPDNQKRDVSNTASLFQGDKGQKVIRLVMNAMNSLLSHDFLEATRQDSHDSELAVNIIEVVEEEALCEWLTRKEGTSTVRKLIDKLDLQVDHNVVIQICSFLSRVSSRVRQEIPGHLLVGRKICDRALIHFARANPTIELADTLRGLLLFVEPQIPSMTIMFNRLLSFMTNERPSWQSWEQRGEAVLFLQLIKTLRSIDKIHPTIARSLASKEHTEVLHSFVNMSTSGVEISQEIQIWLELHQELCGLILDVQLGDLPEDDRLDLKLRKQVVRKMELVSKLASLPTRSTLRRGPQISLQQAVNTPYSGLGSHAWRERLLDDLQTEALHQHSRVISRVDVICRDLERRAEIHEEPLRAVEHELAAARGVIEHLEFRISEATQELQHRDDENQSAYEERQRLEGAISELISEVETGNSRMKVSEANEARLTMSVQAAENELSTFKLDAANEIQILQQRYSTLETEITSLKCNLESEEAENDRLAMDISERQEITNAKYEEIKELKQDLAGVRAALVKSHEKDVIQRNAHSSRLEEVQRCRDELETAVKQTLANLGQVKDDLAQSREQCDNFNEQQEALQSLLEETKLIADERLVLQQENHLSAMTSLRDELLLNKQRADESAKILERENTTLRSALGKLKGSYERRCKEFQKAQELSRRLMAVMGGTTPTTPSAHSTTPRSQAGSVDTSMTVKRHRASTNHSKDNEKGYSDGDLTTDMSFEFSEKENLSKKTDARRSSTREDSAILTELSGLGI